LPARMLFDLTVEASAITRASATRILVNDRADIALAAGADGVHLTTRSLGVEVIRKSFAKHLIIGQSVHTVDEAKRSASSGADFIVFGPVFQTPSKDSYQGVAKLFEVCSAVVPFPVLAIGGIDDANISSVMKMGAAGFAAIRALNDPASLKAMCLKV